MKLSNLSHTLIGSEIVKLGGEIRERISKGEHIYNFTVGDFDPKNFPIPKELEDAIIEAYQNHFTNYPPGEGSLELRQAVSAFARQYQGLEYSTDEILIASGGRPLIYALFRAICDKGDKVIYAVPSWNNNHYTHFVEAEHVVVEAKPENNFMPVADDIRPFISDACFLALCSPQNPTGTTFKKEDLQAICDMVVEENTRRGEDEKKLYVMFDQMYWHLTYDGIKHYDPVTLNPAMRNYTVYIDAISKVFASTGVRVGWSFGPAQVLNKMKAILSHVGAWAPMAEQKALIKFDLTGKKTKEGNVLSQQSDVTSYLLQHASLAVVPFYAFGASKNSPWYRLSVGTCKKEEINEMIEKLNTALKNLS